ncbi:MAG: T9SS type A sorting domain-containing protein [Ginsengibacter sp.]
MGKLIVLSLLFFCSAYCVAQSGNLDPSFGNRGIVKTDMGSPFIINSIGRQILTGPDGNIYILFNNPTFISKRFPDGSIDSGYGLNGYSRAVSFNDAFAARQPDGKIVIVGSGFGVARIDANGMPDSTFGDNGMQTGFDVNSSASSVAIQSDGRIVVAGTEETNGDTYFAVARYNPDGSPDMSFKGKGQVITDFGFKVPPGMGETDSIGIHQQYATSIGIQANGKIVVGGYASNGSDFDFAIARYNINGNLDNTFGNNGKQTTKIGSSDDFGYSLVIENDGKIILAGYTTVGTNNHFAIVRYNINGSPDSTFNGNGKQTANLGSDLQIGNSVAIQGDGKIVVAGYTLSGPDNNDFAIARFNSDGGPDITFDNDGTVITDFTSSDDYAGSVAIQSDGKIVVAGYSNIYSPVNLQRMAVSRYNVNGSLDNSFGSNGKLIEDYKQGDTRFNSTAIQSDGKIVTAGLTWTGSDYDFAIARYNINGRLDSTFSDDGKQITDFGAKDEAVSVVIQPDGKIVVAGNSDAQFAIARYNTDGSPDNTFSDDGKLLISMGFADACQSVALQRDGKIVMAGYTFIDNNYDSSEFAIARLNSNGTPDNTFNGNGKQLTNFGGYNDFASSVAIQTDGKIVAAGRSFLNNQDNFSIARYNTDGSPDTTFSHDGKQNNVFGQDSYFAKSLAIQKDGKIVVAGFSETTSGKSSLFAVARYKTNGELDNTFNDDGFQNTFLGPHFNFGTSIAVADDGRIAVGGTNDNFAMALYKVNGSLDSAFGNNGIQTTDIGIGGSSIQSMAFVNNNLYATGYGQFPGSFGVTAKYLLTEGAPLPVSLLDFTGILQNKSVLLQWKIETEKDLAGFVIERSGNGNTFLPINNLTVTGVSRATANYSIVDAQPLQGINFYRLKMVDADGKFTYSNIVAVKITSDITLHIFPNPATKVLFVEANGNNENAVLQIVDAGGRKLKEMKVFLNGQTSFSIDVTCLPDGIYNLILRKKEKTEVQIFMRK